MTTSLLGLVVAAPFALTHHKDFPFERRYGNAMKSIVAKLGAGGTATPVGPDARVTDGARAAFTGSCATCHGARGAGNGVFGPNTSPNAADLTSPEVRGSSDGALFWITKNGLGFTAMPAFATPYRDADLWALADVVAYVNTFDARRSAR